EGSDLLAIDSDRTNQVILLEHRHDQKRPSSGNLGDRLIGIFRSYVGDVCDLLRVSDMVEDTGRATRRNRIALAISGPRLRCIVQRDVPEYIAFVEQQVAEAGLADANGVLKHSLEHWLQFAGRAADDLEHLGGGRLLLQRLAQFSEQARVLDRDRGLVGKGLHQGDLLLREGSHLTAPNADDSDQIRLPKKRDGQHSAGLFVLKDYGREARLDGHIRNVHGPALQGRQPRRSLPSRREPRTHELLGKFWRAITGCLSYE